MYLPLCFNCILTFYHFLLPSEHLDGFSCCYVLATFLCVFPIYITKRKQYEGSINLMSGHIERIISYSTKIFGWLFLINPMLYMNVTAKIVWLFCKQMILILSCLQFRWLLCLCISTSWLRSWELNGWILKTLLIMQQPTIFQRLPSKSNDNRFVHVIWNIFYKSSPNAVTNFDSIFLLAHEINYKMEDPTLKDHRLKVLI